MARDRRQLTGRSAGIALVLCMSAGAAMGQDRPGPRRIAPDQFPDYGVQAPAAPPAPAPSAPLIAPTLASPLGACSRDMPAGVFLRCLRDTSAQSRQALDAVLARVKDGFAAREDVNDVMRQAWSRALDESQTRWRALRDQECQQLALAEPEAPKELFEARLICIIRRDLARARTLAERYRLDD